MESLSDILLLPTVTISLFLDSLLFILLSYALLLTLYLLRNYKEERSSSLFYSLEKKSHLLLSIISLSIFTKVLLFPFFFNTLSTLSNILPGAMCSAGVISANEFGTPTLFFKFITILIALLWLRLNREDEITSKQPYFRKKLWLYIFLYISITIELFLEISFFTNLLTDTPVLCCSSLYNIPLEKSFLLTLSPLTLIALFSLLYLSILTLNHLNKRHITTLLLLPFSYVSYYVVVYIFTPYIYELPTHKCPYCMLQEQYYFIGYFIYLSFFMGLYHSLVASLFNFKKSDYKKSSLYFTLFFFLSISSFIFYIIREKTLLSPLF